LPEVHTDEAGIGKNPCKTGETKKVSKAKVNGDDNQIISVFIYSNSSLGFLEGVFLRLADEPMIKVLTRTIASLLALWMHDPKSKMVLHNLVQIGQ